MSISHSMGSLLEIFSLCPFPCSSFLSKINKNLKKKKTKNKKRKPTYSIKLRPTEIPELIGDTEKDYSL